MITLITGVPGQGKTAMLVHMLLKNDRASETARPVFVMGINELKIEHNRCPPLEEWTEKRPDPDDKKILLDYYTFPPNSYLVVDECQRVFRPRSSSSAVPPHVAALETHRHTGLDIILLTQKPNLVDANVRALVGRHVHIRNNVLGVKYLYEWPEYRDVTSTENLKDAVKRKYSPPKEVFGLYKSSELHTKQPTRIHQAFFLLFFALCFFLYFAVSTYNKFTTKMDEPKPTSETITQTPPSDPQQEKTPEPIPEPQKQQITPKMDVPLHPYDGFEFRIVGFIQSAKKSVTFYELNAPSAQVHLTDHELKKIGYNITQLNDCSSFLVFENAKITAFCAPAQVGAERVQTRTAPTQDNVGGVSGGAKPPDVDSIHVPYGTAGLDSATSAYSKY